MRKFLRGGYKNLQVVLGSDSNELTLLIKRETFAHLFLVVCVSVFSVSFCSVFVMLIAMTITAKAHKIVRIQCDLNVSDVCLAQVYDVMNFLSRTTTHPADVSVTG